MPVLIERLTVEQFAALPESETEFYELHNGEVVYTGAPTKGLIDTRCSVSDVLMPVAEPHGILVAELPFCVNKFSLGRADIGFVYWPRWNAVPDTGWLIGAPDLAIELMSPSMNEAEMLAREKLCLASGCREFWTMYPEERRIRVATASQTLIYAPTDTITCSLFPSWSVKVSKLFA
ncbi:MAG: Uma2 family endonuclease [Bryobacteraceae bacterium]|nr:Uma2 family endonuclease [Bryobacteraceae bacterium]